MHRPTRPEPQTETREASPYALTADDQRFCAVAGLDPAAFAMTRAAEIAERQQVARADSAARAPAKEIVSPKAVLSQADRDFCSRMHIDEAQFLAVRQQELDDRARDEAHRNS